MGPSPTYHPPEGEECETSVAHGLPLWAEPAVGYCSRRPRPSPMWGSRFLGARAVGPWVGEQKPFGKSPLRGNPSPESTYLPTYLINAYPRLFSGVANKNPPDRGRFGTARIKLKPNPKIYRHREYQLQGDRAEAMKKLLAEFIERGWIEPSVSEWASPAFIVPNKEKGEWRLLVDYRGLNEKTEHDSYSLPLIDTILQKQQKKRIFTVLDLKQGYH